MTNAGNGGKPPQGRKVLIPTVLPKSRVLDDSTSETEEPVELEDEQASANRLPPIAHIKPPEMQHTSTKIRWYCGLGYEVREVAEFLGIRYQQVRNVCTTEPKRAAREDVPPFIIRVWEVDDDLEAMDKHAMEQQMAAFREETRKVRGGKG